jgi:hypothetical protein
MSSASASANNPALRLQLPPSLPLLGTIPPALAYPPVSPRPASRAGSNRPTQAFVALNSPLAGRVPVPSLPLHQHHQHQQPQQAPSHSEGGFGGESTAAAAAVSSLSTAAANLAINAAASPIAAAPPTQTHAGWSFAGIYSYVQSCVVTLLFLKTLSVLHFPCLRYFLYLSFSAPALAAPKLLLPPTPRAANYFAPPLSARARDTAKPRPNDEREAVRAYLTQHRYCCTVHACVCVCVCLCALVCCWS